MALQMRRVLAVTAGLTLAAVMGGSMVHGDEANDKAIEKIMKATHKGKESIVAKVKAGTQTPDELATLINAYKDLMKLEPPKGSKEDWTERTTKILETLDAVKSGTDGADKKFAKAVSCKACHELHKPEE